MKKAAVFTAFALAVSTLFGGGALAQDKANPLPLGDFVALFTDEKATSAQKEKGLPEGTWYQGIMTVSDVQLYTVKVTGQQVAEIKDWNLDAGCYVMMLRTADLEKALKLKKGDRAVVRGKIAEMGLHVDRFVVDCETYFALFREGEIVEILKSAE